MLICTCIYAWKVSVGAGVRVRTRVKARVNAVSDFQEGCHFYSNQSLWVLICTIGVRAFGLKALLLTELNWNHCLFDL